MNSKFKKVVSAASAFTIAVSALPGIALTASAATVETDYIGSSSAAETFDSYDVTAAGWTSSATLGGTIGSASRTTVADAPTGALVVSGKVLTTRVRGNNASTTSTYAITPVTEGKVVFNANVGTYSSGAYDSHTIVLADSSDTAVLTISVPYNGNIKVNDTSSKFTVSPRNTNPYGYSVAVTIDLDTNKADVTLVYDAANGTTGYTDKISIDIADTNIAALKATQSCYRSSTNEDVNLDDVQFYSTVGSGDAPATDSTPAPTQATGKQATIAVTDADFGLGDFTVADGAITTAKDVTTAIHFAKTTQDAEGNTVPVKLFKDDTYGAAESITIPFSTIPADGREINLYTGISKPVNFGNLVKPTGTVSGIEKYDAKYITDTTERTGININAETPFATLKFGTASGKRTVSINGGTAAEIKNSSVTVPVSGIEDATSLFVYTTGTPNVAGGAFKAITVNFPELKRVNFDLPLTTTVKDNVYYAGKLNTADLTGFEIKTGSVSGSATIDIYGTNAYGSTSFADADKITSKSVSIAAANANKTLDVIAVTANANKPYIYVKVTPANNVTAAISSVTAKYSAEPGTDAAVADDYKAEYAIVNTQLKLQNADVTKLTSTSVAADKDAVDALNTADTEDVFTTYAKEYSYIEETLKGITVKETIDNDIKTIYDAAYADDADSYKVAMDNRSKITSVDSEYKKLLIAGMRCVDNYNTLSTLVKELSNGDAAAAAAYKAAADAVKDISGVTKDKAFSEELINSDKNFVKLNTKLNELKTLNTKLNSGYYDAAAKKAIADAVDVSKAIKDADKKVDGYITDLAAVFSSTLPEVTKVMEDPEKDSKAKSAALNIGNMKDVYDLIGNDITVDENGDEVIGALANKIIGGIGDDYDTYKGYVNQMFAYSKAEEFVNDVTALKELVNETGAADISAADYEKIASEITKVKKELDQYDAAVEEYGALVDTEMAKAVEDNRYYSADAKMFIDQSADNLVKDAKSRINTANNDHSNTAAGAQNIKKAEYAYNQLAKYPNLQAYLGEQEIESGKTYAEAIKEYTDLYDGYKKANNDEIAKLIAQYDDEYTAFVDGLNYTTLVKRTENKDKDGKVTGYSYSNDTNTDYINHYRKAVDNYDDVNRYIDGTVTTTKDGLDVTRAKEGAERKALDTKFDIANKLKTIWDFRNAVYNTETEATVDPTYTADLANALAALVYGTGTTYSDLADKTADDYAKDVEDAYKAGRIDYTSKVVPTDEHSNTVGDNTAKVLKAYTDNSAAYKSAYAAYTAMFEADLEDEEKYDQTEDLVVLERGDALAEAINTKLAELKGVESVVSAAKKEAEDVNAKIDEIYNKAVNEGYAKSSDVDGANKTFADLTKRVADDYANDDYKAVVKVSGEKVDFFDLYYTAASKLATVETALEYWTIATTLYDDVETGIDEAKLKKNDDGSYTYDSSKYDKAYAVYDDGNGGGYVNDEPQKAAYFNAVAANNDNADVLTNMNAKIDAYNSVITNYANKISTNPLATNIAEYKALAPIFYSLTDVESEDYDADKDNSVEKYIRAINAEDATEEQKAELELVNTDFADLAAEYEAKVERLHVIAPAADFTDLVDEIYGAEDTLEAVKKAIDKINSIIGTADNNSKESLDYISESTMNDYNWWVDKYKTQLEKEFTEAYAALDKGSIKTPKSADDEEWMNAVKDVLTKYDRMVADHKKAHQAEKTALDNIVETNKGYADAKKSADAIIKNIKDADAAYTKNKDTAAAKKAVADIRAAYEKLADKYGDVYAYTYDEDGNVVSKTLIKSNAVIAYIGGDNEDNKDYIAVLDNLEAAVESAENAEALLKEYKDAVAAIDLYNITIDSYSTIQKAEDAFWVAYYAGLIDRTTGYGVIGSAWNIFNDLDSVKAADAAAKVVNDEIIALPSIYASKETILEAAEAINKAKADYDALAVTDYGKSLVSEYRVEKLNTLLEILNGPEKSVYDLNSDGDVDIFDLNMAILAAFGRDVYVKNIAGEDTEVTVASIVDTDGNGRISLTELKAVVNAFSANDDEVEE